MHTSIPYIRDLLHITRMYVCIYFVIKHNNRAYVQDSVSKSGAIFIRAYQVHAICKGRTPHEKTKTSLQSAREHESLRR